MNEPQHSEKTGEMRPILSVIGNTSKELLREIAIKSTKSLINIGDEMSPRLETTSEYLKKVGFSEKSTESLIDIGNKMPLKPENMSRYLKKIGFSDAIVDAAMRQAGFVIDDVTSPVV